MTPELNDQTENRAPGEATQAAPSPRARRRSAFAPFIIGVLVVLVVILGYVLFATLSRSEPTPTNPPDTAPGAAAPDHTAPERVDARVPESAERSEKSESTRTKQKRSPKPSATDESDDAGGLGEEGDPDESGEAGEAGGLGEAASDPLFWEVFRNEESATQFDPSLLTVDRLDQLHETLTRWRERLDLLDANSAESLGDYLSQASVELGSDEFANAIQSERARRAWEEVLALIRTLQDELAERGALRLDSSGYLAEPFDRDTTQIPPGFRGHSVEQVVAALQASAAFNVARKSGESDRAYDERLDEIRREAAERTLFGTVKYGSTLAFVLAGSDRRLGFGFDLVESHFFVGKKQCELRKLDFAYDFDMYSAEFYQAHRDEIKPIRFLPESVDPATRPFMLKYVASFPSVAKGELKLYGLAMEVDQVKRSRRNKATYERRALRNRAPLSWWVTNLPPEKGKELERYGRVLCLCRLTPESVNETYATTKTFETRVVGQNAYRYNQTDYALRVCDVEFWAYSALSGEIFAKYSAKEADEGKRKVYLGAEVAEKDADESESEPEPTWETIRADYAPDESLALVAPSVVANGKKSFVDALEKSSEGAVIRLESGATIDAGKDALIDKSLVVVGASSESDEAGTIVVGFSSPIVVTSKVVFKNARFEREKSSATIGTSEPIFKIAPGGEATFLDCEFDGRDGADSVAVVATGSGSRATFRGCKAERFTTTAFEATSGGRIDVEFCEFSSNDGAAIATFDGGFATVKSSYFTRNRTSFAASGGGGGEVGGSLFEKNILNFRLSPGSKDACRIGDDNTVKR